MKERPILFSAPMVRAILSGQKTMTRRVLRLPYGNAETPDAIFPDGAGSGWIAWFGPGPHTAEKTARLYPGEDGFKCPQGQPGDRLWVRETWAVADSFLYDGPVDPPRMVVYMADGYVYDFFAEYSPNTSDWNLNILRKKPSIFMPRWASRIILEITNVKVQRLQAISTEDCIAEGISTTLREYDAFCDLNAKFKNLWDSINGKTPGKSWGDNPWVWAVSFKVVK